MIYTLTMNPAIDLFIDTQKMKPNQVNRTKSYDIQANGKGINVSFILKRLGVDNIALGVGGGFTIDYISSCLKQSNINNVFYPSNGITRINVFTRVEDEKREYKLVNPGPPLKSTTEDLLLSKIKQLNSDDILSMSGSLPQGVTPKFIEKIAKISTENNFKFVLDTSVPGISNIFQYEPYLIKPNDVELFGYFDMPYKKSILQCAQLAKKAISKGVQNVLVSLGEKGALFVNKDKILFGNAPKINVLNTAGSGDTMLGSFLAGKVQKLSDEYNLTRSIAAGSDTARSKWITDFKNTNKLEEQINIQSLTDIDVI